MVISTFIFIMYIKMKTIEGVFVNVNNFKTLKFAENMLIIIGRIIKDSQLGKILEKLKTILIPNNINLEDKAIGQIIKSYEFIKKFKVF